MVMEVWREDLSGPLEMGIGGVTLTWFALLLMRRTPHALGVFNTFSAILFRNTTMIYC